MPRKRSSATPIGAQIAIAYWPRKLKNQYLVSIEGNLRIINGITDRRPERSRMFLYGMVLRSHEPCNLDPTPRFGHNLALCWKAGKNAVEQSGVGRVGGYYRTPPSLYSVNGMMSQDVYAGTAHTCTYFVTYFVYKAAEIVQIFRNCLCCSHAWRCYVF